MARQKEPTSLRSIAEKAGLSHNAVSKMRKQGWADEQIIERGHLRYEKAGVKPPEREYSRAKNVTEKKAQQEKPAEQVPPVPAGEVEPGSYSEARLRTERANAKLKELEIAEREGRLVDSEETAKAWANIATRFRDEMQSIPDRISMKLVGKNAREIREALKREIDGVLTLTAEKIRNAA